jgi:hypothetical protein
MLRSKGVNEELQRLLEQLDGVQLEEEQSGIHS